MNFWVFSVKRFVVVLCLSFVSIAQAATFPFDLVDGASIEDVSLFNKAGHQIILSAPKRVNNTLRLEKEELVVGERVSYLVRVNAPSSNTSAFGFYKDLLSESGEIVYQCDQRACGSSNYWANTILNERKLYGRDSDQQYLVAKTQLDNQAAWVSVYAVRNGRKQNYLHVSIVYGNGHHADVWVNGLEVQTPRIDSALVSYIAEHLRQYPEQELWVTARKNVSAGASQRLLTKELEGALSSFAADLAELNGIESARIKTKALGAFGASVQSDNAETVFQLYLLAP